MGAKRRVRQTARKPVSRAVLDRINDFKKVSWADVKRQTDKPARPQEAE